MLTRETFRGPWPGCPSPGPQTGDEATYRADATLLLSSARLYTGGTTGEFMP